MSGTYHQVREKNSLRFGMVAEWRGDREGGWQGGRVAGWQGGRVAGWQGGREGGREGGRVAGRAGETEEGSRPGKIRKKKT